MANYRRLPTHIKARPPFGPRPPAGHNGTVGELQVNHSNHDKISVSWIRNGITPGIEPLEISRPFPFKTEEQLLALWLTCEFTSPSDIIISLHKDVLHAGRAIVSLKVTVNQTEFPVATVVKEHWRESIHFGGLPVPELPTATSATVDCTIDCSITWLGFNGKIEVPPVPSDPWVVTNVSLDNTFKSDFEIMVEDKTIPAHKVILAKHSPVMAAMIDTPMRESRENRMIVDDIDYPAMEVLIRVIYGGTTEPLRDVAVALKVLIAANKYQIEAVRSACEHYLRMNLNDQNAWMILEEAEKCNAKGLCETIVAYIIARNTDTMSSENYTRLYTEKPYLAPGLKPSNSTPTDHKS